MSKLAEQQAGAPTPSTGPDGSDLRTVAGQVEQLLDDDGHFNPNPDQISRGHPDYNPDDDPRETGQNRDSAGRFQKTEADANDGEPGDGDPGELDGDIEDVATGDDPDEDTDTGDTDEDTTDSAEEDADSDDTGTDTDAIDTLDALAEALEISPEELQNSIQHTFNAAGETVTVNLSELISGYQKDADYRQNTAKLANDRQAVETDYRARMQAFEQQNQVLAFTHNLAEQMLSQELNDPRLNALREADPAEWTARRGEIGQRLQALREAGQQAADQYNQFQTNNMSQFKEREMTALKDFIPDWSDGHRNLARNVMESVGYSPDEVGQIYDHRVIKGALELAALRAEVKELRELQTTAAKTVKRVKKTVPKLTKPGKQRSAKNTGLKRNVVAGLRKRAQKSGSVGDAAKVIETLI